MIEEILSYMQSGSWQEQFHAEASECADCRRQLEKCCFVGYIFDIQYLINLDEIPTQASISGHLILQNSSVRR